MEAKAVFDDTYKLLNSIGAVASKKEFYKDWLNRSDSYFRCLRFKNKQPSTQTLALCSSKLKHYSIVLTQKTDDDSKQLANNFASLANKFDAIIYTTSKAKWMDLMEDKASDTIH